MKDFSRRICDFRIAGMRYWDGALALSKLKAGKKLRLALEADNPHDPDAVAIYRKDAKLGYMPCDQNKLVAQLLRFGHDDVLECRVLAVDPTAEPWEQVRASIYATDKRKANRDERS